MNLIGFIGIIVFCLIAFLFSKNRKSIDWKLIIWGIVMQFLIAGITLGKGLISLGTFFIWVWIITWYNIEVLVLRDKKINNILSAVISFLITSLLIFIIYICGAKLSSIIFSFTWYIFLIIGIVKSSANAFGKNIKLPVKWSNIFGVLIPPFILGNLIANGKTGADFFENIGKFVTDFLAFSNLGGEFVFGKLLSSDMGFVFVLSVGSSVIFITAFISLIDALGIMNNVIISTSRFVYWNMKGLGIIPLSGAETLVAVSSIPMGGDNILFIKNYLSKLTKSEIVLSLSSIMATIGAHLFGAFVYMGVSATHIIAASVMSVPAVIAISKIAFPEDEEPVTRGNDIDIIKDENYGKPMPALMTGIWNGIQSILIIAGSLIVFISLIGALDYLLGSLDAYVDGQLLHGVKNAYNEYKGVVPGSLKTLLGYIFSPLAIVMGVPLEDAVRVGYLMGTKVSLNEVVAFTQLGEFIKSGVLTEKSIIISSFALCGFANPGTVAIMLGRVLPFSGENKENYINLIFKTMFIGAAASWMTAAVAGIISGLI
ncbi:nucleoside transporter C-terminal domain-containing protein [uncultured Brachyspira sp.]|uniref:nucleoside transporter C-terminal domain-containing protein n=1 Tax=uncultured Brachyspira sp. TaxID=221953 RepID=UPI0026336B78|nr:nucleoside transporter C-terminal domain-containing protein [uncultured Brachyspira sp.]